MNNFPVIFGQNSGQNSAYFKDITVIQSPFFPRGEIPGYRHTQVAEIHWDTPSERRKGKRKRSSASGTLTYNPYDKRKRVRGTMGGQGPVRPARQAETLTH